MYSVVSIDNDEMTRNVKLKNLETGTIDTCFDDSAVLSDENFDFMKEGGKYNCKIKLFGNVVSNVQDKAVLCKTIKENIIVGAQKMAKVLVEDDEYYVPAKKISKLVDLKEFYFKYSRKDLIEVDNVVHADLL